MAAVPGVTGANCTLTVGPDPGTDYTMWVTSLTTSGDRGSSKTITWGDNSMIHGSTADYTADLAGLFNPETGLNSVMEAALKDQTPVTLTVEYGAAVRTFTDYKVSAYSDEAPADGPVTFTATLTGPDIWATVPAP